MNQSQSTYHSRVYRDFRAIGEGEWRAIVRFYEAHEKEIRGLDFEEYFELVVAYTAALFETGAYQKHLLMAEVVVEASVMNNIKFYKGEDIFHETLFRKAASFYHLHEYAKTDYILRELLRLDPHDEHSTGFLKKCLRKMDTSFVRRARAAAILLFLLSAIIISLEVLVVRNFYPTLSGPVEMSRNLVFLFGCGVLVGGDLLHRWRATREVEYFIAKNKKRKKT